jgi:hypothetical protein
MVDLREKVEDDRGLVKKIEMVIPGFRGYRKREDLRIADSVLREQLANRLKAVERGIEGCRQSLAKKMEMDLLEDAAELVNQITATEGRVRHAEQGYSGVSADYRIEEGQLNRLYEWDLGLLGHIDALKGSVATLQGAIDGGDATAMTQELGNCKNAVRGFNDLFEQRRATIAGLGV